MTENRFGPIAIMLRSKTSDEATDEPNRLPYGLAAYAYTRSLKTAAATAAAFESGTVSINHHGLAPIETPLGGVKDSGYGSEGGSEAIEAYLGTKFVTQTGLGETPPRGTDRARRGQSCRGCDQGQSVMGRHRT